MARLAPQFVEDRALHVIQRSNHRQANFYAEGNYVLFRDWLAGRLFAQIHAWVACKGSLSQGSNSPRAAEFEI